MSRRGRCGTSPAGRRKGVRAGPAAWAAVAGLALALSGCSDVLTPPYEFGAVEVATERRSGAPIPNVDLVLFSGTRHAGFGTTDQDGRHVFELVVEGPRGVTATIPAGYRPTDLSGDRHRTVTFRMEEGGSESVAFTFLKEGPGSVEVRVLDEDEEPVAGVPLQLYSPDGLEGEGETDEEGGHTFSGVPFGRYGVRALPGRGFVLPGGEVFEQDLIVEEDWVEPVGLTVERCMGTVRVRAADVGGAPVSGVPFILYEFTGVADRGRTGEDGVAAFDEVPCGGYGVRPGPLEGYRVVRPASGFVDGLLLEHESALTAEFTLAACRGTIGGRVVDEDGAPVEGVRLELYRFDGLVEAAETDAGGVHDFTGIPCGDYGLRVRPPEGYEVEPGRGSSFFDGIGLDAGDEQRFTFTLSSTGS